jgi:peptide/nickel transport system substrate-binding protein
MHRRRVLSLALAGFAAVVSACSPGPQRAKDALAIADSWEPRSLDPLVLQGTQVALVNNLLFSYLLDVDNAGDPVPEVALAVPTLRNGGISADGKTIRYRLRRDVRWSDGVPLTARDAAYTFAAIADPRNAAASRYGYDLVASVAAPTDDTLIVRMKRPFSPIVSTFLAPGGNYPILPAHVLRGAGPIDRSPFAVRPVGSGPFAVARWDRGDAMTLERNEYFVAQPAIESIHWKFVPSPQTMVSQLRTGEVDAVFGASPSLLPQLRSLPGHRIVVTPVAGMAQWEFNTTDPVVGDVRVRRALAMAVDWPRVVSRATEGNYAAAGAMRGVFGWSYDPGVRYPSSDQRGAAALLAAAGWLPGPGGVRRKNGAPLEVSVAIPADEDTLLRVLTQVQSAEATVGVRLIPHVIAKSLYKSFEGPINQGRFQSGMDRFAADPDPDPSWLVGCDHRAPNGFNRARYCNAAVDAAIADATATYDQVRRTRDYAVVQAAIARDVPFYPIYQDREIDVVPLRLRGFVPSTQDLPLQGVQRWSLAP